MSVKVSNLTISQGLIMTINRLQLFQLITLNYCVLETAMIVTSTGNIGECLAHPVDQEIIYRPLQFDSLFFIIDFSARRGGGAKTKKNKKNTNKTNMAKNTRWSWVLSLELLHSVTY